MIRSLLCAALTIGAASHAATPAGDIPLGSPVVVMGEEHDAPAHHANQADWVRRMAPNAVVFEMLTPDLAEIAMRRGDMDLAELGQALQWTHRGWPVWEAYATIFDAADDALILGADVPRESLFAAASNGAAEAFGADRFGLATPLPPDELAARMVEQGAAHCDMLPPEMLPGMVEAQRLRDAALAAAALDALDRTGGPVAVITGNGHARADRGVPHLLRVERPDLTVTAIGQFTADPADPPFDAWIVTDPPPGREADPCAALTPVRGRQGG